MKLDVNELLEIAKKEVENLKTDEIFLVKELFKGYEWNRLDRNIRLKLGLNNFKPSVPANVYSRIIYTNTRPKLNLLKNYIKS